VSPSYGLRIVNVRVTLAALNQHSLIPGTFGNCLEIHVSSSALIVDPIN
jgi:hypothetical protein